jgi:hypothetical protein
MRGREGAAVAAAAVAPAEEEFRREAMLSFSSYNC